VWQEASVNTNKSKLITQSITERRGPPRLNGPFAKLKDELRHLTDLPEPSDDYITLTAELFHAAAIIYDSEKDRGKVIYTYLERLLGTSLDRSVWPHEEKSNRKTTEADAAVRTPIQINTSVTRWRL
jgi:hypothetical protein